MTGQVLFDPLLPLWALGTLVILSCLFVAWAFWRGLPGWSLRGLTALVLLAALSGPVLHRENRAPLNDIILLLEDQSASQHLGDRVAMTRTAADTLANRIATRPNTELRRITVQDGTDNNGTELMAALAQALAEDPRARIAGIFALSDGHIHDMQRAPDLPSPLHLLHTGRATDWDRRLTVQGAPAFAILDEEIRLTLRIEDSGARPASETDSAPLDISIDGAPPQRFTLRTGMTVELPLTLTHAGRNVIHISVPPAPGELTDRNNSAVVQINGVRDRLRVLLVSGEPHPGGRTWRNLLKSDASVDLVHFTILRPPEKQDGVPVSQLSLIAFPTRELFMEKIDDFDLIIFDRFQRRGILPSLYLENVARYVETGGAVLISAGPDFASASSIFRSPLAEILPARPTARVIDAPFRPKLSPLGARHPVTSDLPRQESWGRWLRQIEVEPTAGNVLMTGHDGLPLLILNRVGEGRVALLASDHAWLWARGFEGGGPQLDLLRRLAHWMMSEPDLEEETLRADATGQTIRILRRSLSTTVGDVTITTPSGTQETLPMQETRPGHFETRYTGPEIGLYRLANDDLTTVIGLGPTAPREFERTIATDEILAPLIKTRQGGSFALEDGLPTLRAVRQGRPAAGRGWMGITPRGATETLNISRTALLPPWLTLLLAASLILFGWLRESRR